MYLLKSLLRNSCSQKKDNSVAKLSLAGIFSNTRNDVSNEKEQSEQNDQPQVRLSLAGIFSNSKKDVSNDYKQGDQKGNSSVSLSLVRKFSTGNKIASSGSERVEQQIEPVGNLEIEEKSSIDADNNELIKFPKHIRWSASQILDEDLSDVSSEELNNLVRELYFAARDASDSDTPLGYELSEIYSEACSKIINELGRRNYY